MAAILNFQYGSDKHIRANGNIFSKPKTDDILLLFGQQAFQLKAFLASLRLVPPDSSMMTTTRADSPKSLQMLPC